MVVPALGLALGQAIIPELMGRLTGGRSSAAEKIANLALEMTGLAPDADENEVLQTINADPELALRFKELAATQAIEAAQAEIKLAQFELEDRKSAREYSKNNEDNSMAKTLAWTAIGFLGVAFSIVVTMAAVSAHYDIEIDSVWVALISAMAGNASDRVSQVFNFFFGSSKGSKDKAQELSRLADEGARTL